MMETLKVGSKCHIDIIENGYWKDSCKGVIVGETKCFWIVESSSHHFYRHKGGFVPRRFSKTNGSVSFRKG